MRMVPAITDTFRIFAFVTFCLILALLNYSSVTSITLVTLQAAEANAWAKQYEYRHTRNNRCRRSENAPLTCQNCTAPSQRWTFRLPPPGPFFPAPPLPHTGGLGSYSQGHPTKHIQHTIHSGSTPCDNLRRRACAKQIHKSMRWRLEWYYNASHIFGQAICLGHVI